MSWHSKWEGRATDFAPDLLAMRGNPGRTAFVARTAAWESVQGVAEQDVHAWVELKIEGMDDPDNPGLGRFSVSVVVKEEPSGVLADVHAQRPHDLLERQGPPGHLSAQDPSRAQAP